MRLGKAAWKRAKQAERIRIAFSIPQKREGLGLGSKYEFWRNPNWYWDQGWKKKEVLALLKRNWKQRKKVAARRRREVIIDDLDQQ